MELDERKEKILKAIIQTYLETGEPVGSRTISKYSGLKLSSATIRNEMSDLEELGYIIQPHTSAGRIPSDKGYRFYVDQIIQEKVSGPNYHQTKLKFIQLSRVEANKLLIVVVVEGNIIRNSFVTLDEELSNEEILNLNILLNNSLNGLTIQEINLGVIARLKEQAGIHRQVVEFVLNEVSEAIGSQAEDLQIYTSGATNIFKYPELSDTENASKLISTLEQKELLKGLFDESQTPSASDSQIQVYIGDEMPVKTMKDCSVVTANYVLGDGLRGTIGIIGPKRMDYEKVVGTLRTLVIQLNETFNKQQ